MSTVRVATGADIGRMARTAMLAFADDPLMRWFHPALETYLALTPSVWRFLSRRAIALGAAYTTDDAVALAIFAPPGRPKVELPPEPDAVPPSDELLSKYEALGRLMTEHTPPEPHWYLNVLAIIGTPGR